MSGSGKLSALKAFEDLGYYSVDNLPLELIPRFAELALQSSEIRRTALVVGSERYGISPPWQASGFRRIGIPMLGSADSLNVAVSAAVLLYEARAQMNGWGGG